MHKSAPMIALVAVCLVTGGCKSVNDYLADLDRVDPRQGQSIFDRTVVIFDEGQLGHEALVGLTKANEMAYWQAMRALARGARFLGRARDNALLRADAAVLIRRLALGIPVPPITEPYGEVEGNLEEVAIVQITKLFGAHRREASEYWSPPATCRRPRWLG